MAAIGTLARLQSQPVRGKPLWNAKRLRNYTAPRSLAAAAASAQADAAAAQRQFRQFDNLHNLESAFVRSSGGSLGFGGGSAVCVLVPPAPVLAMRKRSDAALPVRPTAAAKPRPRSGAKRKQTPISAKQKDKLERRQNYDFQIRACISTRMNNALP